MKKKIITLAGYSGLIGKYLVEMLKDYEVMKIPRSDFSLDDREFASKHKAADVVINLAGA